MYGGIFGCQILYIPLASEVRHMLHIHVAVSTSLRRVAIFVNRTQICQAVRAIDKLQLGLACNSYQMSYLG